MHRSPARSRLAGLVKRKIAARPDTVKDPILTHRSITRIAYTALLFAIAWVSFGDLRTHGIYFHDDETFRDNEVLATDPGFFLSAEREHRAGRPVASALKWWAFAATGNQPGTAHLVAVAVHTVVSLLLAWVCVRFGMHPAIAGLAGLLFLVNVAHFQAVFHISALDFPLALLFSLTGWLVLRVGTFRGHRAAADVLMVLAMACHLATVAAWPLRLYETWQTGVGWRQALRAHTRSGVLAVAMALVLLALTPDETTTSESLQLAGTDPLGALAGTLRMLLWMAARLVTTAHWLAVDPGGMHTAELVLGAVVLLGLAGLTWRRRDSAGVWAMWTLMHLAPFALISEQLATRGREGPSHYLYLATAGASVLLAAGVFDLGSRLAQRVGRAGWLVTVVCVLVLTGSSVLAIRRLQPLSLYNTGRYLFDRDPAISVQYLRRAIDGGGGVVALHEAYLRLVLASPLAGQDPYPVLQEAAALYPASVHVQGGIAVREMESSDPAARERGRQRLAQALAVAREQGQEAALGTNVAALCHNLGVAYERAGAPERAIEVYRRAAGVNPNPRASEQRLANAFRQLADNLIVRGAHTAALAAMDSARKYTERDGALAF